MMVIVVLIMKNYLIANYVLLQFALNVKTIIIYLKKLVLHNAKRVKYIFLIIKFLRLLWKKF